MRKTVLRYGIYGLLTSAMLFLIAFLFLKELDYGLQEVLGYLSMFIALSFIFFGIKHYRDQENNGAVSFGKALLIGLLIAVLTGIGVAIVDYIYTTVINPDFASEYLTKSLETMKASMPIEEFERQKALLEQQMKDFGGSGFMAFIMFVTVVVIGFIISLISAFILQRKPK
ncbi:MAG TPA: DUF4199 domain-containing protein [Flavobacteriaceae bacterium]|nr:DUF4199 domain-containing protein [Flavobacteriaceae bacterium]MCB9212162.1 DUF4199 domain-containing protein [Alteromonas sp.]HPF10460.1 DUF4199 domain-containing protein [Flavobacteriaceae bacterium]HQU21769.1 DUF4199 domain-containing protein [Flavobacteriaceae bacterium]HQU64671.1 DUF4199 domain-containing protein [Flavobacteriaceae bacterium]